MKPAPILRWNPLLENWDTSRIAAEFKDGALNLRLPKNEKSRPKVLEAKIT